MSDKPVTIEEIKSTLTQFRDEIKTLIPELAKKESDSANAEIASLKAQQAKIEKALGDVEEAIKKNNSFGLPGAEFEKKNFSFTKFFRAMYEIAARGKGGCPDTSDPWKNAPLEKEIIDQYAKRRGAEIMSGIAVTKDFNATDGSQGAFLVPNEIVSEVVEMVYPLMPIMNMPGVRRLDGLRGDLPVPVQTGKMTGYHIPETGKPTYSEGKFGLKTLRPKKVGGFTKVSNRLMYQTGGVADSIIKGLLSESVAEEMNRGLTVGKGAENEALGLLSHSGMSGFDLGTNGARLRFDDCVKMRQSLATANELRDTPTYGYLMRPEPYFGLLRERVAMYNGQAQKDRLPIMPGAVSMTPEQLAGQLGYAIRHTTQIPGTVVKGTSSTCSKAIFGDWSKFWVGMWRDVAFRVSDVASDGQGGSAFLEDQLYLAMFMEYDCLLMRPAAMALIGDAETNESNW